MEQRPQLLDGNILENITLWEDTPDINRVMQVCSSVGMEGMLERFPQGLLTKVGYTLTGVHPRNFTLTADNRFLLVALRDSNSVEVYARDEKTGLLTRTAISLELSHPVCLLWM